MKATLLITFLSAAALCSARPVHAESCAGAPPATFVCLGGPTEDLVSLPGSDWIIGSNDLRVINTKDRSHFLLFPDESRHDKQVYGACPGPLQGPETKARKLNAHGINVRPGVGGKHTLYVVHHGERESVEVLEVGLRDDKPVAVWLGCVLMPPDFSANGIAVLPDNGFAVTNFARPSIGPFMGEGSAQTLAMFTDRKTTGEVWEWAPASGWKPVPGTEGSGPNGIEASADGKWIYLNEWAAGKVHKISRGATPVVRESTSLGFLPDNLRRQNDGHLLAVGHDNTPVDVIDTCVAKKNCDVVKVNAALIDPTTLKARTIVHHLPAKDYFQLGTTGLIVGNDVWVGAGVGEGIQLVPLKR